MLVVLAQVALGGAIGSVLRFLTLLAVGTPLGTLLVNVSGSFLMGVFLVTFASRTNLSPLLMTGILGGFTTFSAFSMDAMRLWQSGQTAQSVLYVAASVAFSLIAVALGATLAKGALG